MEFIAKGAVVAALVFQLAFDADPYMKFRVPGHPGWGCCGGKDCKPLPDKDVSEVTGGYQVKGWGFIPFDATQDGFDNHFHLCEYPPGKIRCFLTPASGA